MLEEIAKIDYKDSNCITFDLDENSCSLQFHEMSSEHNMCSFEESIELEEKKMNFIVGLQMISVKNQQILKQINMKTVFVKNFIFQRI